MNPGRWRHIADTYAKLDSLPEGFDLEGFLYDPGAARIDSRVLRIVLGIALVLAGLALAYIYVLRRFNRDLASQVSARTRTLEEVNATLAREVEAGRAKEEALAKKPGGKGGPPPGSPPPGQEQPPDHREPCKPGDGGRGFHLWGRIPPQHPEPGPGNVPWPMSSFTPPMTCPS